MAVGFPCLVLQESLQIRDSSFTVPNNEGLGDPSGPVFPRMSGVLDFEYFFPPISKLPSISRCCGRGCRDPKRQGSRDVHARDPRCRITSRSKPPS